MSHVSSTRPAARPLRGLYAITPDDLAPDALLRAVEAALDGGAVAVQYRRKHVTDPVAYRADAEALRDACRRHRAAFVVNDDVALAVALGADGVHVGRDDADCASARAQLGPDALVGVSCYASLGRARAAVAAGASYVAFGSMFRSAVKPDAVHAPLALLKEARTALDVPVVAIGGITADNAGDVFAHGAHAVAVITDLFHASDVRARAALFTTLAAAHSRPGAFTTTEIHRS